MENRFINLGQAIEFCRQCEPESEHVVYCTGQIINGMYDAFKGISHKRIDSGIFSITMPKAKPENTKAIILKALKSYKGGHVPLNVGESYLRVVVSNYNKEHKTRFRVMRENDDVSIYIDQADRNWITESEFNERVDKILIEINELRKLVRSDRFFQELEDDFDNGVPEITRETISQQIGDDISAPQPVEHVEEQETHHEQPVKAFEPIDGLPNTCKECGDTVPDGWMHCEDCHPM